MNYKFLRARDQFQRDLMFRSLGQTGPVDVNKYEMIYHGEIEDAGADKPLLDCLFETFNINHPADFRHAAYGTIFAGLVEAGAMIVARIPPAAA